MHAHETTEGHLREGFNRRYLENSAPWDIGKPQAPFVAFADYVKGPVLDVGCGTGNTALFFAERGLAVTGIDLAPEAIRRAREKAAGRGLAAEFQVRDVMTLSAWGKTFASVLDSGLFHIFHGDDQRRYVREIAGALEPGGRLFLLGYSDAGPGKWHGGGLSRQELHDVFADGWTIEFLELVDGEVAPAFRRESFAEAKMWFAVIRREKEAH